MIKKKLEKEFFVQNNGQILLINSNNILWINIFLPNKNLKTFTK